MICSFSFLELDVCANLFHFWVFSCVILNLNPMVVFAISISKSYCLKALIKLPLALESCYKGWQSIRKRVEDRNTHSNRDTCPKPQANQTKCHLMIRSQLKGNTCQKANQTTTSSFNATVRLQLHISQKMRLKPLNIPIVVQT